MTEWEHIDHRPVFDFISSLFAEKMQQATGQPWFVRYSIDCAHFRFHFASPTVRQCDTAEWTVNVIIDKYKTWSEFIAVAVAEMVKRAKKRATWSEGDFLEFVQAKNRHQDDDLLWVRPYHVEWFKDVEWTN